MDRGAWWATVQRVIKSRARLSMHTAGPLVRQRKGVGVPSSEESSRETVKSSVLGSSSRSLPLASYLISFPTPDEPEDPPQHACATFSQDGFQPKGQREGGLALPIMGWCPSSFDPPRRLPVPVQRLPCPKEGKYFMQKEFSPPVPAHSCIKTGRKPGSLPYFCYSFFEMQTGG